MRSVHNGRLISRAVSCTARRGGSTMTTRQDTAGSTTSASTSPTGPSFDLIEHWCALCCEPISSWTEHIGKREHIALGMVFDAVVAAPRQWRATDVWCEAEQYFGSPRRMHRVSRTDSPPPGSPADRFRRRHRLPPHSVVPCEDSAWHDMLHWYDGHDTSLGRREAICDCLRWWSTRGVLAPLLVPTYFTAASFHGTLVLFKDLFPPLAKAFPHAAAKDVSAMTQMVSTAFHLETLFDLCDLGASVPPGLMAARSARASVGESSHTSSSGGEEASVTFKANYVRAVLGLMRWAIEPDSLQTTFELPPPASTGCAGDDRAAFGPWVATPNRGTCAQRWSAAACSTDAVLASHTAQLIVTELIASRLGEYVSRVEPVVREAEARHGAGGLAKMHACLRRQQHAAVHGGGGVSRPSLQPLPSHAGAVAYLQNDVVSDLSPFTAPRW